MLRTTYGSIIIKKDTILYHTTDEEFSYRPNKPMLFTTIHPSEWEGINDYVVKIQLKRDVELLFMISEFKKNFIFSSLNNLSNNRNYLSKQSDKKLKCFVEKLREQNLDGWLSSIENKSQIEVTIINDSDIFEPVSFEPLHRNWRNGNNLNGKKNYKNWGNIYPISSRMIPVIFNLNMRYKPMINEYIQFGLKSKYPFEYALQIILENAIIKYHECSYEEIKWTC